MTGKIFYMFLLCLMFVFPQKGDQKKMVDMAFANASERLSKYVSRTGREVAALDALAKLLGLKKPPVYIEAYDISNLGESSKVGGMVVFENGRPLKKAYKKRAQVILTLLAPS